MQITSRAIRRWVLTSLALAGASVGAAAQLNHGVPTGTEGVGIIQRVGESLPLELPFTDHTGRAVRLGEYFEAGRPTLLTLNYGDCPMLCIAQLDGVVELVGQLDFELGSEYQLVTVSIDPRESAAKAAATRAHYLERLSGGAGPEGARPEGAGPEGALLDDDAWPFLVGPQSSIDSLAQALGFGFRFVPETGEFAHDAAMMLATPEGRIARYFFGIRYEPKTVRLSMVEASAGRLGTIVDQFSLLCFVYDHEQGVYTATAVSVMRLGGLLTVVILGGFLFSFWRKELLSLVTLGRVRRAESSLEGVS